MAHRLRWIRQLPIAPCAHRLCMPAARRRWASSMRAIVVDPADQSMRWTEVPEPPPPGDTEVLMEVVSTSVNRADLLQRQGRYPPPPGASPYIGLEAAGVVQSVGSKVTRWRPGDRVCALLAGGGYAEKVCVHEGSLLPVPDSVPLVEAGGVAECYLTAFLNVFLEGGITTGDTVLMHGGASGVGTSLIRLCTEAGVKIAVTAGSERKIQACLQLGATYAVNYRDPQWPEKLPPVHLILDATGAAHLPANLRLLRPSGRLVLIGAAVPKGELDARLVVGKQLRISGSMLRPRPVEEKARIVEAFLKQFGAAYMAGKLRPVVHAQLPIEQAAAAHTILQAGENVGKVLLVVRPAR